MANALNRQYVKTVRDIVNAMPPPPKDPLIDYVKYVGPVKHIFTFKKISMDELRRCISSMKTTGSGASDQISSWMLKQAFPQLEPLLLHLSNRIIETSIFPSTLKISKILPIEKLGKPTTDSSGWRPINIVNTIAKVIERILLKQILEHLERNKLVGHIHHGSVSHKSTQTLVSEIYSQLLENFQKDEDTVLLQLDQSKAFEIVDPQNTN